MAETQRLERLQARLDRERRRREEAERIAERATRDLYERQRDLEELAATLEHRVEQRTHQLERRLAQQARLADASGLALQGIRMPELAQEVCQATASVLDTDYCGVFEVAPEGDLLVLRAGVGWPDSYVDEKTVEATPDCQTGHTLRQRKPTVVEDVREDDRFQAPGLLDEADVRSGVTVVVPSPDEAWGILGVHSRTPSAFDETDTSFVRSMGHVLSQAIQRDRSRRELEAYADRLEQANEELESFAHLASHDLKEPVRMVKSYLDLLGSRHGDQLDEDATELVEYAREGARRVHTLVEGLLRYARVDAEATDRQPVDADEVLDDVLASLSMRIEETGARIDREPLGTVEADRTQLGQVLQNLVSNAIKFAEPGEEPRIAIRADRQDGVWRFSIADDGVGMAPEDTEGLFEMFTQGPERETTEGQGIGLAVSRKIVERHDGEIWVDTAPGEGSTFHLTLPAAEPAEEGPR